MMRLTGPRSQVAWLSLVLTLGAGALTLLAGNPLDPWAAILWVGSMIVFVVGLAAIDGRIRLDGVRSWVKAFRSRAAVTEILWVAGVTLLALGLRATALGEFPPGMHGDEGEMGLLALDIREGTRPLSPFTTAWLRHPTMVYFWQAASMGLFGENLVGLRMLSAVVGALSVPLLYLLVRIGFGRLAGLVSASMLAASHLHIHFSRLAINNIESSMLMILTLLLVVLGATKRSRLLWGLAGLAGGYGLYFYFGSQVVPIIALLILARLGFSRRLSKQELAVFTLGFFLVTSPLLLHYVQNPQIVSERMRGVFLLTSKNLQHTASGIDRPEGQSEADLLTVLGFQLQRNLGFFLREGDASSFYLRDLPAFDPLTATLLWLGMGLALVRPYRLPEFVLLAWFWTVFVTGGMLTRDAPNAPRLLMAVPAVFAFGGVFVGRGRVLLSRTLKLRLDPLLAAVLLALAAVLLRTNYETYFVNYAVHAPWQGVLAMAQEMEAAKEGHRMYLIGAPTLYIRHGVLRFVARDAERTDCIAVKDCLPLSLSEKGAIFFILPERLAELPVIQAQYPNGSYKEERDNLGRLAYATYSLPAVS